MPRAKARRSTSRRKVGSTKAKSTKKINGKTFKKDGCSQTITAAKKRAKRLREQGYLARRDGKCVWKGPKRRK